jgi:hypothetical protein
MPSPISAPRATPKQIRISPTKVPASKWFSESQFESYRALGFEIMDDTLKRGAQLLTNEDQPTLGGILEPLSNQTK